MSNRACRICGERRAVFCASCGPHQSAPDLKARGDREGLRAVEDQAQSLMAAIESTLPSGWGAVVLFAQHGQKGYASYVSSLDRSAIPTFLRECATMIEERSDKAPGRLGFEN